MKHLLFSLILTLASVPAFAQPQGQTNPAPVEMLGQALPTVQAVNTLCLSQTTRDSYFEEVGANNPGAYTGGTNCAGGTLRFDWNSTRVLFAVPGYFPNGTGAAPSIAQGSDPDNGIFFGTNQVRFATAGVERWNVSASGHLLAFADNTYDIGAVAATRPKDIYVANIVYAAGSSNSAFCSAGAASYFGWSTRSYIKSPSDGVISLTNNAETDFSRLQFGGTTSSFPALKRSSAQLEVKLADDSGYTDFRASRLIATSGYLLDSVALSVTAPTGPVACTSPTVTWSNGTAAFQIDVGGTCAAVTTLVVTLPAAANAWSCTAINVTSSATAVVEMTASTTTTATFTNYTRTTGLALAWVDGSDVRISCLGG